MPWIIHKIIITNAMGTHVVLPFHIHYKCHGCPQKNVMGYTRKYNLTCGHMLICHGIYIIIVMVCTKNDMVSTFFPWGHILICYDKYMLLKLKLPWLTHVDSLL